jgi:hypothetical protein
MDLPGVNRDTSSFQAVLLDIVDAEDTGFVVASGREEVAERVAARRDLDAGGLAAADVQRRRARPS